MKHLGQEKPFYPKVGHSQKIYSIYFVLLSGKSTVHYDCF